MGPGGKMPLSTAGETPAATWEQCADAPVAGERYIFLLEAGQFWRMVYGTICVNRKRMKIFYSGSVQGVGFRYTVRSVANGFEVTGTVRNLPDGRVELEAEGARDELEAFRRAILDAGLEHFVQDEAVSWSEATNEFRGFEIVR